VALLLIVLKEVRITQSTVYLEHITTKLLKLYVRIVQQASTVKQLQEIQYHVQKATGVVPKLRQLMKTLVKQAFTILLQREQL
jgi:hypothetical protein